MGARLVRLDGRRKVDGTEVYGADRWPAGASCCGWCARRTTGRASGSATWRRCWRGIRGWCAS